MSNFLSLNFKDILHGLLMAILGFFVAVITSLITQAQAIFASGTVNFSWSFWWPVILTAIGSGLGYIIKKYLSNSNNQFLTKREHQHSPFSFQVFWSLKLQGQMSFASATGSFDINLQGQYLNP